VVLQGGAQPRASCAARLIAAFMSHLVSVTTLDGALSRWITKGPAGTTVEWEARIINDIENELIAWQSVEGSTVASAGSIRFTGDNRGTTVRVRLQYNPPAGKAGAAIASLFGEEPRVQVREDLRRVKQLLEAGEIATTEGQPAGRRGARRFSLSRRPAKTEAVCKLSAGTAGATCASSVYRTRRS
jgi:uncharacterized membrane protein